jgi:pimeloyl-ACP methyl ester carboxylesterase
VAEIIQLAPERGSRTANVIFVHGLTGNSLETWTSPSPENAVWPKWLAEDLEGVAVYSIGYDAPLSDRDRATMHPTDLASNVLNRLLVDSRFNEGEVILGHSLGGLVIKLMLRRAEAEKNGRAEAASFIDRVRKVAFLATPHTGADLAGWGDLLRVLVHPSPAALSLVRNDPNLRELNEGYRNLARDREIVHLILTERRPLIIRRKELGVTYFRKNLGMIVKPDSGDPGLSSNPIPIDADHIEIAKPANRESEIYQHIRSFVARHVERPVSHEEKKIDGVKDDTQAIREKVDRLTAELSMSVADREALVADLAKVKAKHGGTVDLVSGFLETMVGRKVAPEQFAATLFKIAGDWKSAGEKIDALSYSGNLSPHLSVLRDQAKAAHEAGRLDEAEKLLGQIARAEIDALKRLEDHDREVQEEIQLRKRGVADTKAAHAAVAHARLNYRDAAALYGEAASLVASFEPERRRTLLSAQAAELYAQATNLGTMRRYTSLLSFAE